MQIVTNADAPTPRTAPTRSLCWIAVLVSVMGLAACSPVGDLFGPDTETGRFVISGIVTSGADGSPIEGAKVYPYYPSWIVGSGPPLVSDTARTDAAGRYLLDTEHYCDSQLAAKAAGYMTRTTNLGFLDCAARDNNMAVDIVLEPVP